MLRARRFLILLVLLVVVAGVLWWLARLYLSSQRITAQVASRLQAAYGAPVQLGQADIGIRGSSLHHVQIFESKASAEEPPWLVIEDAQANIPLWDLIKTGTLPSQLSLTGVTITLRFDKSGHLLTHIPMSGSKLEKLPDVTIEDGRIIIQQEGHPEFTITGLRTETHDQDQHLDLTGSVTDPTWGDWKINGSLDRKTDAGSATLRTQDVHFTQAKLEQLPFVPEKVWQQVKLEGDTAIEGTIRYDPTAERAHLQFTLEPRATQVYVPSIELRADHGQGKINIRDGIINVTDLQARAANGQIKATGRIDLEHSPPQLQFNVAASKLDLGKIPKSWRLPEFPGQPLLSGRADLQAKFVNGKIQTSGSGQGMITGVRIPGAPESKPILLKLYPSGEGFRFGSPASESQSRRSNPAPTAFLLVALVTPQEPEPPPTLLTTPAEVANFVGMGVLRGVDALTRAGNKLISWLPQRRTAPAKPQTSPSYLEAQFGLDNVDVAQLVKGLKIPVPFPITGRLSFNVQLAFPLDTPRDLKTYRLHGTAHSPSLVVAGQELQGLRARVDYSNGILRLEELRGRIPAHAGQGTASAKPGTFAGTAQLQVVPAGDLTARLKLETIPLSGALGFLPKEAEQARGVFSGNVAVRVPADKLKDLAAWNASGAITSQRLELYGLALENVDLSVRVRQGRASLQLTRGRLEETPVTAAAELHLADPYPFTGKVSLQNADLAALQHLSPDVKPPVSIQGQLDVTADMSGSLSPFVFHTSGQGTVKNVALDRVQVGSLAFRWEGDSNRIKVSELHARLYGGELTGSAVLPLRAAVAGHVEVRIQNLDVGALSHDVPNLPVRLEGQATGRFDGTLSAAEAGRPREFASKLELQAPQLRVQGIPTERLHASVNYRNHVLTYQMEGETLGGKFHLNGQIPATKPPGAPEGRLRIQGVRLGRLVEALRIPTVAPAVRGVLNLDVAFQHTGPHQEPVGGGGFSLENLRWGPGNPLGTVRGEVLLTPGEFRLRNLAGEFAQGLLRGQMVVDLRQLNRSRFNLALDEVDASRLLAPWPSLAERVEGQLQVRLRGRLGRQWYGAGEIALARARLAGVEVLDWRFPFDWAFAPGIGTGQADFRESTGLFALGRVISRASLAWGTGLRVDGNIRFFNVQLRPLLEEMGQLSQMGTGQVSGRFDFSGSDVRSLNDVTGTLDARLQQTQALQLPVLQQVTPFLLGGQSSSAVFQSGNLRGRLGGGTFRIEQLTFAGSLVQLFVNGTVTLQGRLNLQVLANTGNLGVNPTFVRFLGLRIPAIGPIPVTLLLEASTYLSNRLVHLRVTGTLRSPIITVEPVSLLTEEAVRFFVNRSSLPVP